MSDKLRTATAALHKALDACTAATDRETFWAAVEKAVAALADWADAAKAETFDESTCRAAVGVVTTNTRDNPAERQAMKTLQELETMLPAPVTGIAGCTEFNDKRAATWAAVETAHRMTSAKLDQLHGDDVTRRFGRINLEGDLAKAQCVFEREVAKLIGARRALLCEPNPTAAKTELVDFVTSPLLLPVNTRGAAAFNAKVADFGRRQMDALKATSAARGKAIFAWADNETDATLRARNLAMRAMDEAARPFIAERKRLVAERAALTTAKKGKVKS